MASVWRCPNCGGNLDSATDEICSSCGAIFGEMPIWKPVKASPSRAIAKSEQDWFCPKCGKPFITNDWKLCPWCNASFTADSLLKPTQKPPKGVAGIDLGLLVALQTVNALVVLLFASSFLTAVIALFLAQFWLASVITTIVLIRKRRANDALKIALITTPTAFALLWLYADVFA